MTLSPFIMALILLQQIINPRKDNFNCKIQAYLWTTIIVFQMTQQTISQYKVILNKHQSFLKKFKLFPQKSRKAIYVQLMQLPLNHQHFVELTKPYPLLPQHSVDKQVSFIVSAFVRLYPDLANQWLPGLVHPFVKLFKEDAIAAFQISLCFLINWFRPIFEDYPNSSKKIMAFLGRQLPNLQKKVNGFDYPLSAILQPLLLVGLTDVLNKQNTLEVFDYLAAHPFCPQLYLCIAAVLVSKVQQKLCCLESVEDIAIFLRKEKYLDIQNLIKEAVGLAQRQSEQLATIYTNSIFPLSRGRYPVCRFVRQIDKPLNSKLDKTHSELINHLKGKYDRLQGLMKAKIKEGIFVNSEDINKRYSDVQGQMRQYMNQIRQEHRKKLAVVKDMEDRYKQMINNQNKIRNNQYEKQLQAIERRGRVERQILLMQQQANTIREAEQAMMRRLDSIAEMKKQELAVQNRRLRVQQRQIH